jgi:hypothetical protein
MGWFSSFVDNTVGAVTDTVKAVVDTTNSAIESTGNALTNHPLESAAAAAALYFGLPPVTAESGSAAFAADTAAVTEGSVTATELGSLGTAEASTAGLSGIDLGGVGGSPATWTNATTANMTGSATTGWTAGQVASTVTSGLNLATSAAKLGALTKMTTTPTASGLTNALASGPSTVVTTPNGPETVANQAIGASTAQPSSGMDTQTILVIAAAVAGIWFILKKG